MLIKYMERSFSEKSAKIRGRSESVNRANNETCFKLGFDPHKPFRRTRWINEYKIINLNHNSIV
jgi:hypothetical protein